MLIVPGSRDRRMMRWPVLGSTQSVGGSLAGSVVLGVEVSDVVFAESLDEFDALVADPESAALLGDSSAARTSSPHPATTQHASKMPAGTFEKRMILTPPENS